MQHWIIGFYCKGEVKVVESILMRAINPSVVRQPHEFLQGGIELGRAAFKQASAASREQGIAAEQRVLAGIGDMTGGVARHVEDIEGGQPGQFDTVAFP